MAEASVVAFSCAVKSASPEMRRPCFWTAQMCSLATSYANTSASPARARCAANRLPMAPQPTMQILIRLPCRGDALARERSLVKLPFHIRQVFAFLLADAERVLRVQADPPV